MIVVLKLHIGEKIVPVILPLINKEMKELLQLLVNPLRLSVSLGVVCGSGCQLNSKKSVQFFGEFHYNWGPLSDTTLLGSPWCFQTCQR